MRKGGRECYTFFSMLISLFPCCSLPPAPSQAFSSSPPPSPSFFPEPSFMSTGRFTLKQKHGRWLVGREGGREKRGREGNEEKGWVIRADVTHNIKVAKATRNCIPKYIQTRHPSLLPSFPPSLHLSSTPYPPWQCGSSSFLFLLLWTGKSGVERGV